MELDVLACALRSFASPPVSPPNRLQPSFRLYRDPWRTPNRGSVPLADRPILMHSCVELLY
jgi:hypothetical protein